MTQQQAAHCCRRPPIHLQGIRARLKTSSRREAGQHAMVRCAEGPHNPRCWALIFPAKKTAGVVKVAIPWHRSEATATRKPAAPGLLPQKPHPDPFLNGFMLLDSACAGAAPARTTCDSRSSSASFSLRLPDSSVRVRVTAGWRAHAPARRARAPARRRRAPRATAGPAAPLPGCPAPQGQGLSAPARSRKAHHWTSEPLRPQQSSSSASSLVCRLRRLCRQHSRKASFKLALHQEAFSPVALDCHVIHSQLPAPHMARRALLDLHGLYAWGRALLTASAAAATVSASDLSDPCASPWLAPACASARTRTKMPSSHTRLASKQK